MARCLARTVQLADPTTQELRGMDRERRRSSVKALIDKGKLMIRYARDKCVKHPKRMCAKVELAQKTVKNAKASLKEHSLKVDLLISSFHKDEK